MIQRLSPRRSLWVIPAGLVGLAALLHLAGEHRAAEGVLLMLSSVLAAAASVPYLLGILRGHTRPRLVTWGTWSLLTGMAATASAAAGDWPAAIFTGIGTVACAAIVVVGWRAGTRDVGVFDLVCSGLVLIGLLAWQFTDEPAVAVLVACLVDLIGLAPTLAHVWDRPQEEDATTYALIAAGGLCAAAAAWGDWSVTALAYPLYAAASTAAVAVLTCRRPRAGLPASWEEAQVVDTSTC